MPFARKREQNHKSFLEIQPKTRKCASVFLAEFCKGSLLVSQEEWFACAGKILRLTASARGARVLPLLLQNPCTKTKLNALAFQRIDFVQHAFIYNLSADDLRLFQAAGDDSGFQRESSFPSEILRSECSLRGCNLSQALLLASKAGALLRFKKISSVRGFLVVCSPIKESTDCR